MKKPSWHELRPSREAAALCALAFAAACTGTLGDAGDGVGAPPTVADDGSQAGSDPQAFQPAAGMLRRLTRTQFRNAVRDVFGVEVDIHELDADSWYGNFAVIGAAAVVTSERGVEQYHTAIERAVDAVFDDPARRSELIGCTPSGAENDACVRGFIEALGRRAWRRPLEAAELDQIAAVATTAATELGSAVEGARWATVALFTSPNFLYRPELGAPSADGSLRLTGYEMASRLAFLVWNSLPDQELLDQAARGELDTVEGVRAAAIRLLEAPAGREAVGAFAEEYMRLDRISTQAKDAELFPEYNAALQAAMVRDMRGTWEALAFDEQASALELFSTTKVVVNKELAQLYGLDTAGLGSSTFEVRSLPADGPRVGILGKPAFLSQFANQKEGSPTLRGKFMREALMCTTVPPPPGNVALELPEPPADKPLTKRQRLELHRTAPACAGCHGLMDPLGLPLETFDAVGQYRTTDHGLPIDPSGEFNGEDVADARDLGMTISSSDAVARCLVRKYYTYAAGHEERPVDRSVVDALAASFAASGFNLRELVLDVVTNEAFSTVAPQP
ncbi:DUF1592 domain-containing protein [Sorangium sp. So ce513]|uniref:DUF1592 domain-containing protein n=1 Tax=Sorangium sp. So ce513 TaxID=3133315 RepID=UPI003F62F859